MSRVIVIHWESTALRAIVLRTAVDRAHVEAVASISLDGDDAAVGRKLAAALERYSANRTPKIAAVSRQQLNWQHLSLPPCPDDDLPDLVRMQSDYSSSSEDLAGLDFLPLAGDAATPHRVWAISLATPQLARFRRILRAAELNIEHLFPLSFGWPAWARHVSPARNERAIIWSAPQGEEPMIWATVGERVVLFRQLQLPHTDEESLTSAVAGEIRRTLLAFGQEQPQAGEPLVQLVGDEPDSLKSLAGKLSSKLQREVQAIGTNATTHDVSAPVIGLALDQAAGIAPLVDLLHPRRRPPPRTSRRTYTLAAAAAASLALLLGWKFYADLHAPLDAAAVARAETKLLGESKTTLSEAELRATAVRGWLNGSVNLLDELEVLSTHVRPEPLKSKDFPADTDVVIGKVALQNRQFTIDALAKENRVMQPLETRLRDGIHRVQRGKTEKSETVPGYPLSFQSIVDVTDAAPSTEAPQP